MTHSEMDELYELFLMGTLDLADAAEIRVHLNRNCDYCMAHLKESEEVVASLASMAPLTVPPPELRDRILTIARRGEPRKNAYWPVAFGLACAASVGLALIGVSEQKALDRTRDQLQEVSRQRNELRSALAILSESDVRTVQFGGTQAGPHGRVFLSRSGGVFVGGQLPQLASGKTFELWLVPAKGNPQAAGLFTPNALGVSVDVLPTQINAANFAAVAVSVEPDGGSPQPTTTPILIVPLG